MDKRRLFTKLTALAILWAIGWSLLRFEIFQPILSSRFSESTAFTLSIVISLIFGIVFEIAFLVILLKREGVKDFRKFFKIETLDVRGIWLALGLGIVWQIVSVAFLSNLLFEPTRNFLTSLGIGGARIGLSSGEIVPLLSPLQAMLLTVFLLLFWWVEIPEELFFRGYVQNKLQGVMGKNAAMFLSALIWDVTHLWGIVNILERFFSGLIQLALVFRLRQNTTPTMITHPIGNRSILLTVIIPQIWSLTLEGSQVWLFLLFLDVILIIAIIAGWKILKLDRDNLKK